MQDWYKYTVRRSVASKLIEDKGFIKSDGLEHSGVLVSGSEIETGTGTIKVVEVFNEPDQTYGKFIAVPC